MNICAVKAVGGVIKFDDISCLDQSVSLAEIVDGLKEDLFQAAFPFEQVIDIGWYPEFSRHGFFRVVLVSRSNWSMPVYSAKAKNWDELESVLMSALREVKFY